MIAKRRGREFAAMLREIPTPEEWGVFFSFGFDPSNPVQLRDKALFLLMYRSGLRVGEACALELSGLDMDEGRVDVPDVPGLTKRGARTTYFPAAPDLRDAVAAWLAVRDGWHPSTSRVFTTRTGGPIRDTTIMRQGIRRAAIAAWNVRRTHAGPDTASTHMRYGTRSPHKPSTTAHRSTSCKPRSATSRRTKRSGT